MAMSRSLGAMSLTTRPPISIVPALALVEPGDDVEQRGLAAAGGPDQHGEFTALDVEIDPLQHFQIGVPLRQGTNAQRRHEDLITNPITSRPPQ